MSITSGGVSIPVGADLKPFEKSLKKAEGIASGFGSKLKKAFSGLVWDSSSFVAGLKMSSKEFDNFIDKTNKAKEKYQDLIQLSDSLKQSGMWSQIGEKAQHAIEEAVSAANAEVKAYDRTLKHMGRGQRLKNIFGGLRNGFTKIGSLFAGLRKHTENVQTSMGSLLKKILALAGVGALLNKAFSLGSEGMDNLYKADSRTKNSIDSFRNALAGLKNALAAAFAPILSVVLPILTKFIGILTRAANAVAHFFAVLTGQKTVTVATESVSDGVAGIGDSASSANDSAKELQRTLMGFDKINKLDSTNDSGGGGGGGGGGGSGGAGFETVPVSSVVSDWAQKFKEAWENGGDFYWLGESLANKFNDALEKIPWTKIQDGARKLATAFATFLNGFIENADWNLVGETIANALNTAVYFAQTFVHKFNWAALGTAIADTINGFVSKTDWSAIGDTIGTAIYGCLTTINTFLKKTDWSAIGSAIVETIASIDWVKLFTGAVELIGNVAGAIFDMLSGAITTARDKLKKWIDSGKIWDDLFTIGSKVVEVSISLVKKGWSTIGAFIGSAVDVAVSLIKSGWGKISYFLFGAGKEQGAETVGISLTKNGWNTVKEWMANKIGGAVDVAVSLTASFGSGVKKVSDWVEKQIGGAVSVPVGLRKNFGKGISTVTGWIQKKAWGKGIYKKVGLIRSGWTTVANWIKSHWGGSTTAKVEMSGTNQTAKGGIYKGGKWLPIERYASGGMPNGSQLFWAREAGPELVGTLGGHTAVMNNDQIVASVSSGVAKAVSGVKFKVNATPKLANASPTAQTESSSATDTRELENLLKQLLTAVKSLDLEVNLDGEAIKDNTVKRINNHTRATGQLELIM